MRIADEMSISMPVVDSRIRYRVLELLLFFDRQRESNDMRIAAAEPSGQSSLRKAANGSTTKLPPKVQRSRPAVHNVIAPPPRAGGSQPDDGDSRSLDAKAPSQQQRHGADRQPDLRQGRQKSER